MKLVDVLARELAEWPKDCQVIVQEKDRELFAGDCSIEFGGIARWYGNGRHQDPKNHLSTLASDWKSAKVTREQWQAARTAYLSSIQSERDPEIAAITDRVYGQLEAIESVSYEQELWDKAALSAMQGIVSAGAFHGFMYQQRPDAAAQFGADCAEAFMAERAKRMEGCV